MVRESGLGKVYFASDFHLGAPNAEQSLIREKRIVAWLEKIRDDAKELYLMGDLFDFWFEYKKTVPKGFTRLLGKLAELSDQGIEISIFPGNHDLWMFGYLSEELGAKIYMEPTHKRILGKDFYLAHGDGLGPGDKGYKLLNKVFKNRLCQWLFRWLHPDVGISFANYCSRSSRAQTGSGDAEFLGEDKEWLILHSKDVIKEKNYDYLVFGHRHYPLLLSLTETATYVNLGDWIQYFTYGVFDGQEFKLLEA